MTKKDYLKMAAIFKEHSPDEALVIDFADMLAADNPRFDYERFMEASGYGDEL